MRVLVIGGANFIGPRVVRRLADAGHEVAVFHRGRTEAELPEGVGHIRGDRWRLGDHAEALRGFGPDVVLDMIPMNERDARGVVEVFRGVARRVVAISSEDVYRAYDVVRGLVPGPPDPVPLSEDAPLRERLYPYDREGIEEYEKILVERVVMGDPDLAGTVLRLPAVYGPGDYQHRMFDYVKRMDDGRPGILVGEGMAGSGSRPGLRDRDRTTWCVVDRREIGSPWDKIERFDPFVPRRRAGHGGPVSIREKAHPRRMDLA